MGDGVGPLVSIIIGFRDRELQRVERCLNSIRDQSYNSYEVIFIDYGSNDNIGASIRKLLSTYHFVRYIYNNTIGWFWNRAHAYNTGLQVASGQIILFYDIDLIVEKEFLAKLIKLDFQTSFFTFSCFYLPRNFQYELKILENDGIHFEQNYVGLCAVKKERLDQINGFDEYYMSWGGEDDDLYLRLQRTSLARIQIQATQLFVFHQWHPTQSPRKPSLWYLTMVNYLYRSIKRQSLSLQVGKVYLEEERPLISSVSKGAFRNYNKLSFFIDHNFLFFNSFIENFSKLANGEGGFIEYEHVEEPATGRFRNLFKREKIRNVAINRSDVAAFFEYFVGTNRHRISDYYIKNEDSKLLFVFLKNELDKKKD